jgi:hypothetical protein
LIDSFAFYRSLDKQYSIFCCHRIIEQNEQKKRAYSMAHITGDVSHRTELPKYHGLLTCNDEAFSGERFLPCFRGFTKFHHFDKILP